MVPSGYAHISLKQLIGGGQSRPFVFKGQRVNYAAYANANNQRAYPLNANKLEAEKNRQASH